MAYGDAFSLNEVGAFQLADFAKRSGVERRLLKREAVRLAKLAAQHAPTQALANDYVNDAERTLAGQLRDFVVAQADKLVALASDAVKISDDYL
jgi:serine/threonine-protein kinase HipA